MIETPPLQTDVTRSPAMAHGPEGRQCGHRVRRADQRCVGQARPPGLPRPKNARASKKRARNGVGRVCLGVDPFSILFKFSTSVL